MFFGGIVPQKEEGNGLILLKSRQRASTMPGLEALRGEAPAWEASRLQLVAFRQISP